MLPVLFFSASELSTLDEYEEMITEVFEQQLETILFSVNQYAWDFVNTWISRIQNSLTLEDKSYINKSILQILETNSAIAHVIISDTLMKSPEYLQ